MNENLNKYQQELSNWREILKKNQLKTRIIVAIFLLLYLVIGFIIDILIYSSANRGVSVSQILKGLLTLQIFPIATVALLAVGVISILIAFKFHSQLVLIGQEYKEIKDGQFDDDIEQKVYNVIEEMKIAAGIKYMPKIFIINANYMNAFASGYNEKNSLIAITRKLAENLNRSELQAVLAHELTHIRHEDIKLTMMISILSNIMLIVIDLLFWNMLFSGDNDSQGENQLFIVIIILRYLLPIIAVMLMMFLSRTREYMADAGAVELMRDNEPLASALIKITENHVDNKKKFTNEYQKNKCEYLRQQSYIFDPQLAGIKPSKSLSELFSTHPTTEKRLEALGFKATEKPL